MEQLVHVATIMAVSLATAVASELLSKRFVYDLPAYTAGREQIAEVTASVEEAKNRPRVGDKSKLDLSRGVADKEATLARLNQGIAGLSLRATFIMTIVNIGVFWLLSSAYQGVTVMRLPFEPISWVAGLTHRGVEGDDMRDAGFLAVYVLFSGATRPFVAKLMGTEGMAASMTGSLFGSMK